MISDPSLTTTLDIPETFVFPVVLNDDNFNDYIKDLEGAEISDRYGVIIHAEDVENLESRHNYIILTMYSESLSFYDAVKVDFLIDKNGEVWVEFDLPIKCHQINIWLDGKFTLTYLEIYAVSRSASIATTTNVGTVSVPKEGGIKVEADGRIGVNIGDGLNITKEGVICTTSDLSGSNWINLFRFTNGFIVNGSMAEDGTISPTSGYFFERLASGDLLYKNADRTITIASYNSTMPEYVAPEVTDGEEGEADGI